MDKDGSLVVVGVGINLAQTTLEAKANIEKADKVFYLVSDPLATKWIEKLNKNTESLYSLYEVGTDRINTYNLMIETIMGAVSKGLRVCSAFYGHPGVFVDPSHRVVQQALQEGYSARMLPGVSAEDCLFAELGIDPSKFGCQSFEATDFLICDRKFDPSSSLVLWQVGAIGDLTYQKKYNTHGIEVLLEKLIPIYGEKQSVTIYEASAFPNCKSKIVSLPLADIIEADVTAVSTLYIPPKVQSFPNRHVMKKLGIQGF